MLNPLSMPEELARPGHLFPLRARPDLLKERRGHTEASITLMKALRLTPLAVISEVMNDDGTMARMPELEIVAMKDRLQILSIEEIVKELNI
jgi:3,4-dihydroxy-2-butanone 4-phosphate synthase